MTEHGPKRLGRVKLWQDVAVMAWCEHCLGWLFQQPDVCPECQNTGLDPIPWTELFTSGTGYGR